MTQPKPQRHRSTTGSGAAVLASFLAALVVAAGAFRAPAATPEQVDQAIQKAIKYIYSQQQRGNWEVVDAPQINPGNLHDGQQDVRRWQWGGLTAMATCALLYARESPQDPRVKQALDWLVASEMYGIYAMGFRCQVWQMAPNHPRARDAARRDKEYLLRAIHKPAPKKIKWQIGMFPYFYWEPKPQEWYDHSVSQYGVLALWALHQLHLEIPDGAWEMMDRAWRESQFEQGGWSYRMEEKGADQGGGPPDQTFSMTAAGIASLFITNDILKSMQGLTCTGNIQDPNIEAGFKWVVANWGKWRSRMYYNAYGIERIGVASGHKYFGTVDWYKEISDALVKSQNADGSWGNEEVHHNPKRIPDTCFALMALIRGRAPVMINKLDYVTDQAGDRPRPPTWNQRPRDVANITRWTSHRLEKDLNWQIVNLNVKVDDLHDAPILWISGKDMLRFSPEHEAKLKLFVEQGGVIVGHADCASKPFAESFRKLGAKLFGGEFRELPESHPIYTNQGARRAPRKTGQSILQGLTNGTRELMLLYATTDPGKLWQTQNFLGADKEAQAELMLSVFLYAVDKKNLRYKGETYIVTPDPKATVKHKVKVARIEHGGNWNPEPGGWRRLAAVMRNTRQTELVVEPVKLGSGKLTGGGYQVAHLTGTIGFTLPPGEAEELKKFVEAGGTLVVDAAGGSGDFFAKAEEQVLAMFPSAKAEVLKIDHPVYSSGEKIAEVEFRTFAKKVLLGAAVRQPRLRAITIKDKARVFLSAEDLSVGLVGMPIDGIYGYEPKVATSLMANIIQYASPVPGGGKK